MKIVSLSPSTTEIIYALGAEDQLVGVTAFCDNPAEAKRKPKVGGWSTADPAKVYALKPDIVLTSTIVQGQAADKFTDTPFRHEHFDPRSVADILSNILQIGEIINRSSEAKALVAKMRIEIASIGDKQSAMSRKRIYCEEWPEPPMISGNWVPELVELAGGTYDIIKKGEISRAITDEELVNWDPEIIILNYCGFGTRSSTEKIKKRPGWENISAIKNNRVYVIDDSLLNRPGPRIVEGLKQLCEIILSAHQPGS